MYTHQLADPDSSAEGHDPAYRFDVGQSCAEAAASHKRLKIKLSRTERNGRCRALIHDLNDERLTPSPRSCTPKRSS
jgi:hypothetical protein